MPDVQFVSESRIEQVSCTAQDCCDHDISLGYEGLRGIIIYLNNCHVVFA